MSLSTSQRVSLIKEISQRLGGESWALIDLTLSQFGLPVSDSWSGDNSAYILKMIQNASDQVLLDLAQHVGFALDSTAASYIEPAFWRKGMFRLFISHLAAHKKWAGDLQEALLPYGISGFVAHSDIEPTTEWQNQIETALLTCDALVALLHEKFHESEWTDQEVGFAMGRGVPVYSVQFGEAPYGFIGRFQAFSGSKTDPTGLAHQIFKAYYKNKQTKKAMSEVLVRLFEQSGSFMEAKARIAYLEELDVWEPSFAKRILSAAEANSQIYGSWGVPARVERLAEKWAAK
ncbi:MAG: toll/interleukin-1 receptor domain-containing protein [Terracidiphilus sp.]